MRIRFAFQGVAADLAASILVGVLEEARRKSITVEYELSDFSMKRFYERKEYTAYDALIGILPEHYDTVLEYWQKVEKHLPSVHVFFNKHLTDTNFVTSDESTTITKSVDHLVKQGCGRIGYYDPTGGSATYSMYRRRLFLDYMKMKALPLAQSWVYGFDIENEALEFNRPLEPFIETNYSVDLANLPDAFVAPYSYSALKLIFFLQKNNVRIPEDVAIVCFGVGDGVKRICEFEFGDEDFISNVSDDFSLIGRSALTLSSEILLEGKARTGNNVLVPRVIKIGKSSLRETNPTSQLSDVNAQTIIEDLTASYFDDPEVSYKLAEHFNTSQKYFLIKFKRLFNENFTTYLNSFRIKKAEELIAATDISITKIAYQVGFNEVNTFYYWFKRCCACSPSEYRKKYRTT